MPATRLQLMQDFSGRLRLARMLRGLEQPELGRRAAIPPRVISRYEDGEILPTLVTLVRFSQALGVTTDYLLGFGDGSLPRERKR